MNDDKIRISPDALIAMIVTEAQDRELAQMPSLEEMNEDFQPSEKFQRKMEALVHDTKRKAERKKRLLDIKRFFITLTAAISIFSCTMLPVKAVREAVITTLIEWHDKFVSIIYSHFLPDETMNKLFTGADGETLYTDDGYQYKLSTMPWCQDGTCKR